MQYASEHPRSHLHTLFSPIVPFNHYFLSSRSIYLFPPSYTSHTPLSLANCKVSLGAGGIVGCDPLGLTHHYSNTHLNTEVQGLSADVQMRTAFGEWTKVTTPEHSCVNFK
jgi:hypothetical protein